MNSNSCLEKFSLKLEDSTIMSTEKEQLFESQRFNNRDDELSEPLLSQTDNDNKGNSNRKSRNSYENIITSKVKKFTGFSILLLLILSQVPYLKLSPAERLKRLTEGYLHILEHSNLASNWSERYTSEVHLAGTNIGLAEFTASKFEEFGFKSKIEPFNVYINYPTEQSLHLLNEKHESIYSPTLKEDEYKDDPTTIGNDTIPAFHGYSANGNVTAEYVFANYGTREDFDLLVENNVAITGNIVVVRYGKIFRGLKVQFAEQLGAVGVLIYSDPADDYSDEDESPYPGGPGRNPSSIQRGSVQFISTLPGDPARFLSDEEKQNGGLDNLDSIPHIPSLPISSKEVEPILKELKGKGQKLGFEGGIKGFDYSTGPTKNITLSIYNNNEYKFQDVHNVYGLHEGEDKSKVIILGNHRDAWIKGGAGDPNSGSAVLLEIARSLKFLFDKGFKPKYSILLASWDGEEYALLGSTAFAEKYSKILKKEVVAYINLDAAVTGTNLNIASSPLLNRFLLKVADKIEHPISEKSLRKEYSLDDKIHILGSGSDYTAFFEHLGITSVDIGFGPGKGDAYYHYHSNYDSYKWISTFGDPGFVYHNTLAKFIGALVLEISETRLLTSFSAGYYSLKVTEYFDELVDKFPKKWIHEKIQFEDDEGNVRNTTFKHLIGKTKHELHHLISKAIDTDKEAKALQTLWETDIFKSKNPLKRWAFTRKVNIINDKLKDFEKGAFLHEEGLEGRSWFKHIVFASGRYTGYAGQKLPGLTEAVEDLNFELAVKWTKILKASANYAIGNLIA